MSAFGLRFMSACWLDALELSLGGSRGLGGSRVALGIVGSCSGCWLVSAFGLRFMSVC